MLYRADAHSCNCETSQMTLDVIGTRMTLTGPAYVSRFAKLSPCIESRGLIDQSLNALAESEIASTVAITLASGHVGGTNVPNNRSY